MSCRFTHVYTDEGPTKLLKAYDELTPEQQTCVIEAIGETAFSEIFTGQRPPTLEELQKIDACGVPIGPG